MTQNKKKKTFTVSWTESVGYYVDIEANSKEEALEEWMRGDCDHMPEPDGWAETEGDSVEVKEKEKEKEGGLFIEVQPPTMPAPDFPPHS